MVKATGLPKNRFAWRVTTAKYPVPYDPLWTSTSWNAAAAGVAIVSGLADLQPGSY
jgi:hypothetical protein